MKQFNSLRQNIGSASQRQTSELSKPVSPEGLLVRYERALKGAEVYDAPTLLEVERAIRAKLRGSPATEQAAVAARVREIQERILGWSRPSAWSDEAAPELRALGFCELAIAESRRLQ